MCLWKERKKCIVACSLRYLEGTTKLKKPRTLCSELSIDAKETYVNDPCTIKKFKERLKEIQGTCVKYYTNSVPSKVRTVQVLRFVAVTVHTLSNIANNTKIKKIQERAHALKYILL